MGHDCFTLTAGSSPYKAQQARQQAQARNAQKAADTQQVIQVVSSLFLQGASLWAQAKQVGGAQQAGAVQQTAVAQQPQAPQLPGPMSKSQAKATLASTTKALQQHNAMIAHYDMQLESFKSIDQEKQDVERQIEDLEKSAYGAKDAKVESKKDGNNIQKVN